MYNFRNKIRSPEFFNLINDWADFDSISSSAEVVESFFDELNFDRIGLASFIHSVFDFCPGDCDVFNNDGDNPI